MKPVESDRLDAEERRELSSSISEFLKSVLSRCPMRHMCGRRKPISVMLVMIRSLSWRGIYWKKRLNTECV